MDPTLDELKASVAAIKNASDSAEALIRGFAGRLAALLQTATDFASLKAGVQGEVSTLNTEAGELAAAVVENTPAE